MGCPGVEKETKENGGAHELWWLGVILSIVGSICSNMGVNLQKYSFMREAKRRVTHKRSYVRQPLWVVGLLLVVGGSALDFVALGFLPQSLAAPIGGSTMVANVAFASLFLKEKFTRMDALGTFLVMVGICVAASFADKESGCYTIDELVALYREPFFIVYALLMGSAAFGIFFLLKHMQKVKARHGTSSHAYRRFRKLHPVSYPALSGICGAQSILFAKSVAELIKTTFEGDSQFANGITYVMLLAMFASVFLQIHWLAHGLQFFDAVFIVPAFQCFFISVSIFGGGVYFKEFARMSTLSLVMFFLGAGITITGVYLLSHRDMHKLKPRGRFRAAVSTIIFVKRCQKARNIDYRWVQGNHEPLVVAGGSHAAALDAKGSNKPASRLSKASVVPVTTGNAGFYSPPNVSDLEKSKTATSTEPGDVSRKGSTTTTATSTEPGDVSRKGSTTTTATTTTASGGLGDAVDFAAQAGKRIAK